LATRYFWFDLHLSVFGCSVALVGEGHRQKRGNTLLDFITAHAEAVRTTLWGIADARFTMQFDFGQGYSLIANLNEDFDFHFFENEFESGKFVAFIYGGTETSSYGFEYELAPTREALLDAYAEALRLVSISE
jgi:hypothetical protein